MSSNSTIEVTRFLNEVVGEKCRNYLLPLLLYSLRLNLGEGFSIGCYPFFLDSMVCKFSAFPFLFPDLLFGWIVSASFLAFPQECGCSSLGLDSNNILLSIVFSLSCSG